MIETHNLVKKFGEFTAVDHLNLDVRQNEIFCFLGPNGAGKTTTIKMLCGLLRPTAGTIAIAGTDIHADPLAVRRICGYIPDQPYLYDRLTAMEYCLFTADMFRLPRKQAEEDLEGYFNLLGLNEHRGALVKDLSHGLRQRLLYAATLIHQPRIIFVDEPFVGLDPYSIRTIRTLLREKAREGATIFLTTHILALAEDLADRVAIISRGRLVDCDTLPNLKARHAAEGTLEDIFLNLTHEHSPS
jgi:ABC-2 type transport system ATP-binding protein